MNGSGRTGPGEGRLANSRFHYYHGFQRTLKQPIVMKCSQPQLLSAAVAALKGALADVPFCTLTPRPLPRGLRDDGVDLVAKLALPKGERLLIAQTKQTGQPRIAREAGSQLLRWRTKYPHSVLVFIAPYISPEAADLLTRDGVGYIDLAGNCRLVFDQVYIRREGWPNKSAKRRDLRSLYSPKAERVLRILLLEPKRPWKVQPLAAAAGVSLGQASNVKRLLQDREWVGHEGDGIVLRQPAKLLEEWAQNYRFGRNTPRDFYSLDTPAKAEAKLAAACRKARTNYAMTGFSAAARMAPMVRYQRATAYVLGNVDEIASGLGLKAVSSGANVSLIEPYDAGVLAGSREVDGTRIVSPVQTYLDLLSFKGRGEEAAQTVLEQAIRPKW